MGLMGEYIGRIYKEVKTGQFIWWSNKLVSVGYTAPRAKLINPANTLKAKQILAL